MNAASWIRRAVMAALKELEAGGRPSVDAFDVACALIIYALEDNNAVTKEAADRAFLLMRERVDAALADGKRKASHERSE